MEDRENQNRLLMLQMVAKRKEKQLLRLVLGLHLKFHDLWWLSEPLHIYCGRWKCLLNKAACLCVLSNTAQMHC